MGEEQWEITGSFDFLVTSFLKVVLREIVSMMRNKRLAENSA